MEQFLLQLFCTLYFLVIPFIVNQYYNDCSTRTFLRFYFYKKKYVSWFGYSILIIITSFSLIYYLLFRILDLLVTGTYYTLAPVCKFLFISRRCRTKRNK